MAISGIKGTDYNPIAQNEKTRSNTAGTTPGSATARAQEWLQKVGLPMYHATGGTEPSTSWLKKAGAGLPFSGASDSKKPPLSADKEMSARGRRGIQQIMQLLTMFLQLIRQLLSMSGGEKGGSANKPKPVVEGPKPSQMIPVKGGGRVSYSFTNNSSKARQVGFMKDPTKPMAVSRILQPGESATFSIPDGISAYFAVADSKGRFQPSASRFEVFSDNGKANVNVSYITGRNASFLVRDSQGYSKGDNRPVAGRAPSGILRFDSAGNPTITGWYDGSTPEMRSGGAFMENALGGTGGAYIHPDDDRRGPGQNPMTMAQNPGNHFSISIGDA